MVKAKDMVEENVTDMVGIPAVSEKRTISPESIPGISLFKKKRAKVSLSEMEIERRKSEDRFKELQINDIKVYLLNTNHQIVPTTSRMCGEDEYLFTMREQSLRIWRGGISVFEDGSKDILFHRPHIAIDFDDDKWKLLTDIHSFDVRPFLRILEAVNALKEYIGKPE